MTDALESAKQRLRAALVAGADTTPHRVAIARLEEAEQARLAAANLLLSEAQAADAAAVRERENELVAEVLTGVGAMIDRLPAVPRLAPFGGA